jgi:hypothetical protein
MEFHLVILIKNQFHQKEFKSIWLKTRIRIMFKSIQIILQAKIHRVRPKQV